MAAGQFRSRVAAVRCVAFASASVIAADVAAAQAPDAAPPPTVGVPGRTPLSAAAPAPAPAKTSPTAQTPTVTDRGAQPSPPPTTNPAEQQEVLAPTSSAGSAGGEIIVTATKRQQTLQDTPVSVSVTSAATLEQAQIRDLTDLQSVVPSLRVEQLQSTTNTSFFIRGFGNGGNNPGLEPSVGVFIDGVYRSRTAADVGDLTNVSRIEVLRGPQSTLFGKNASAGIVSITTQKPQFKLGGLADFTYENYDGYVGKFDLTGPLLGNTVAFDVNGGVNRRDGYAHDLTTGADINNRHRYNFGGQLLIDPIDGLSIRLIGDYSNIDERCCYVANVNAGSTVPLINAIAQADRRGPGIVADDPFSYTQRTNFVPKNHVENYGGSGQVDYTTGPYTITSITAYRQLRSNQNQDGDFTAADIIGSAPQSLDTNTFTQELRLATNYTGRLNFLLGGFFFNENLTATNSLFFGQDARTYLNTLAQGSLPLIEALTGNPTGTFDQPGQGVAERFHQYDRSYSFFVNADLKITDKLTLTGGLNYTDDAKTVSGRQTNTDAFSQIDLVALGTRLGVPAAVANTAANPLIGLKALQFLPQLLNFPNAVENGRTDDDKVTYTARLAYRFNRHLNTYLTYATGFKASSWNLSRDSRPFASDFVPGSPVTGPAASPIRDAGLALNNLTTGTRYAGPERSRVYEGGIKLDFPQLSFNFDLFDQEIRGFQGVAFTGTGFSLTNAGKESVYGFEFDGTVTPVRPLSVFVSITYLRPRYDSYPNSTFGDLSGHRPADIPSMNASIGASFTQRINDAATLILRTDFQYSTPTQLVDGLSDFGADAIEAARDFTREIKEVNLSATVRIKEHYELSGFVRNLNNDHYLLLVFPGVAQPQSVEAFPNQPRTYGVSARYKF